MEQHFNQLQCPLCGRSVSISKFDPTDFVNDVIGIRFVGLGYGQGFGVAGKGSILDSGDPVLDLISHRVLEVSLFLLDAGIITKSMLESCFPVLASNTEARVKLSSEVDALEVDNEELENKNKWFKNEVVKLESEIDALEVDVENLERKNAGLKKEVEKLREQQESGVEDEGEDEDETDEIDDDIAEITSMLEEAIGEEFYEIYDESEYTLENLKNMTAFLINEHEALVEWAEEDG